MTDTSHKCMTVSEHTIAKVPLSHILTLPKRGTCSHLKSVLHCVLPNVRHVHCWHGTQGTEVQLLQLATHQAACVCLVVGANVG